MYCPHDPLSYHICFLYDEWIFSYNLFVLTNLSACLYKPSLVMHIDTLSAFVSWIFQNICSTYSFKAILLHLVLKLMYKIKKSEYCVWIKGGRKSKSGSANPAFHTAFCQIRLGPSCKGDNCVFPFPLFLMINP